MNSTLSIILAIATLISIIAAGLYGLDKTYARDVKADKIEAKTERVYQYVQYVDKSLQLKKESDVRDSQQSNYFLWEKEYGPDGKSAQDPKIRDKMFQMKQTLVGQEQKVQELQRSIVAPPAQ